MWNFSRLQDHNFHSSSSIQHNKNPGQDDSSHESNVDKLIKLRTKDGGNEVGYKY